MADAVNPDLPKREQARTRLARGAVVDAARALFMEGGYATTTVAAISDRAGVPEPTVYRLFSSKVGILKVLLDVSIAGDDQPVAVPERPAVVSLVDEPDPRKVLAGFATITTQINVRTNDLYDVLSRAADSDPEAAELFATLREQRDRGQGQLVRMLHRKHALRPGLKLSEATDVVHALMAPEVYRLLVTDRGWSPERYEAWATSLLVQQLT
jgi:AcrR family transcriptional regulator